MLTETAVTWLRTRGIDETTAENLSIESMGRRDGGEVIVFPTMLNGRLVNRKYRPIGGEQSKSGPRFWGDKGGKLTLWNIDCLLDETLNDEPLIVTEGEMDALSALRCAYNRVVSVPNGAPSKTTRGDDGAAQGRYSYITEVSKLLRSVKVVILATDADEPGAALRQDLAIRLGPGRCKWLEYPDGCKDLNDVLVKHGPEGVMRVIADARWYRLNGIYRMSELPIRPAREVRLTGQPALDKHYKIRGGDFTVVTGIPGGGKTAFINDLTARYAELHNATICYAPFEQDPASDFRRAMRQWHSGREPDSQTPENIRQAEDWIDRHFVFVIGERDGDETISLDWVLERCAAAVIRHGAEVVVIDPWNEIEHDRPDAMSLTEYVGFAIKRIKSMASALAVHVIVIAHPTKLPAGRKGEATIPSLYDISDSAHWANKCDVGIVVHPNKNGVTKVLVKKVRFREVLGHPGIKNFAFSPTTRRFTETQFSGDYDD